jgi:hypothetical protein
MLQQTAKGRARRAIAAAPAEAKASPASSLGGGAEPRALEHREGD